MRNSPLSLLLIAALIGAPTVTAFADPAPQARSMPTIPQATTQPAPSDAEQYAAREIKDTEVAKFEGGSEVLIIGGSTLTILLVVLLAVILIR